MVGGHLSSSCPAHTDNCTSPSHKGRMGLGVLAALFVPYDQSSFLSPSNLEFVQKELSWEAK